MSQFRFQDDPAHSLDTNDQVLVLEIGRCAHIHTSTTLPKLSSAVDLKNINKQMFFCKNKFISTTWSET